MCLKDAHALILQTCERIALNEKMYFEDMSRILRWENYYGLQT